MSYLKKVFTLLFFLVLFSLPMFAMPSPTPTITITATITATNTITMTPYYIIPTPTITPTPTPLQHVGAIYLKVSNDVAKQLSFKIEKDINFKIIVSGLNDTINSYVIVDVYGNTQDFADTCNKIKEYYPYYKEYREITDFSDEDYRRITGRNE